MNALVNAAKTDRRTQVLEIAGRACLVVGEGGLYDCQTHTLIVSDLHLEKASAFAKRGRFLPPYDSAITLQFLAAMIDRLSPRCVVCLGDSFHDEDGPRRLSATDVSMIGALQRDRDWIWVSGNHDPLPPKSLAGDCVAQMALGQWLLRHEPSSGQASGEIAGHLHPAATLRTPKILRRRCLLSDGDRAILPALGTYTGGLDVSDQAFDGLFEEARLTAYFLENDEVFPLPIKRNHARG